MSSLGIDALLEDLLVPLTVEHVRRLQSLRVGRRTTVVYLEQVKKVGLLLSVLTDEQYASVVAQLRPSSHHATINETSPPPEGFSSPYPEEGLFND